MTEKKVEGFDLSQLDMSAKSSDGVEFELKHPVTGDLLGSFMTVCGQDSDQYRRAMDKAAEKIRKRAREDGRNNNTPSDYIDSAKEKAIASIVSWRDIVDEGKPVKFTPPNARRILEKYPFFVTQISEVVTDRARFLPGDRG